MRALILHELFRNSFYIACDTCLRVTIFEGRCQCCRTMKVKDQKELKEIKKLL